MVLDIACVLYHLDQVGLENAALLPYHMLLVELLVKPCITEVSYSLAPKAIQTWLWLGNKIPFEKQLKTQFDCYLNLNICPCLQVEHPQRKKTVWHKVLSKQRKRAVVACLRMAPLYNLPRYPRNLSQWMIGVRFLLISCFRCVQELSTVSLPIDHSKQWSIW